MPASNHGVEQCFRKCSVCRNCNFESSASADGQAGLILGGPCMVLPVARQSLTCPWALKLQQLSLSRSQGASERNPRTGPSRQRKAIVLWIHQKGKKARRMRDKPNNQARGNWASHASSLILKNWTHDVLDIPKFAPKTVFLVTIRLRMGTLYDVGWNRICHSLVSRLLPRASTSSLTQFFFSSFQKPQKLSQLMKCKARLFQDCEDPLTISALHFPCPALHKPLSSLFHLFIYVEAYIQCLLCARHCSNHSAFTHITLFITL